VSQIERPTERSSLGRRALRIRPSPAAQRAGGTSRRSRTCPTAAGRRDRRPSPGCHRTPGSRTPTRIAGPARFRTPRRSIRALTFTGLALLAAALLTATPALAAPPETPELKVKPVFASIATFNGTLSPKGLVPAEGTYKFLYKASKTECEGGSETTPGIPLGGAPETLPPEQVKGLTPSTEYTACLSITNLSAETATSSPVTFKTAAPATPEAPEATAVTERKATTATLNGVVDPLKEGEPGHYRFLYKQSASECTGGAETPEETAAGSSPQPVSAAITGLEPGKPYTFCVKAINALGEATLSTPTTFKTAIPPEPPEALKPEPLTAYTATLRGVLNPKAEGDPGTYEFHYRASATECEGEGEKGAPEPPGAALGKKEETVSTAVTGLLPNTQYTVCLRAENTAAEGVVGPPLTFTTPVGAPNVEAESFSNVGSSSATLHAQVNAGGSLASYHFEYGPTAGYGSDTPLASLGSGSTGVSVLAQLGELQPDTVYHFRVVATNAGNETTRGADATFTTLPVGVLGLPDNRGYEMVSPMANQNGNVYVQDGFNFGVGIDTVMPFQASVDGSAVAYVGDSSSSGNGNVGNGGGNQYLATRAPAGGWTAADITPPGSTSPFYEAFSNDLSIGILNSSDPTPLAPGAPTGTGNVLYWRASSDGSYHTLFTATPPNKRFLTAFRVFGYAQQGLAFAGASSDLSHLLFEANNALTLNAVDGGEEQNNLYDSFGGQLRLVNVLPNGTSEANATFGSPGGGVPDFSHAISTDGSRIFWSALNGSALKGEGQPKALYVRENDGQPQSPLDAKGKCMVPTDACTVQVDASQGPGAGGGGVFWTASTDGSKVFFTDESRLTGNSTAASSAPDLYEYNVETGELTDLTVDRNVSEHANVQGVVGASEDGSYVYFVATGVLASGATSENCESGSPSTGCNLYVRHEGVTTFIATLSGADNAAEPFRFGATFGDWQPGLGQRTAEVTPDGRHIAFMSAQSLTHYPNNRNQEVYVYDAGTARLACASCNPSGRSPNAGLFVASVTPGFSDTYQHRWISDDGTRVFFDSSEALVPQDTNGLLDVYEWEQNGAGSCRRSGGCIYLLSGGTSKDGSVFADASASGNDVFIVTRAQLVPQDHLETFKLYDARVNAPQLLSPPACSGTGCQGVPPAPPIFATPSSVTFNGAGNFPPPPAVKPPLKCKKGFVKKHSKCVKAKGKKKKKKTKARKVGNKRRRK
jgi:hypothetical protein